MLSWLQDDAGPNATMWATADESREDILDLYRRVWAHSNATIDALVLEVAPEGAHDQDPRAGRWPGAALGPHTHFNQLKNWRGLATRYDKYALTYLGSMVRASIILWLNA